MAKNWETIRTSKPTLVVDTIKNRKNFEKAIRTTKSLNLFDLKEKGEKSYAEKIARENALIDAYENKLLKSKELIKEAKALKSTRDKEKKQPEVIAEG